MNTLRDSVVTHTKYDFFKMKILSLSRKMKKTKEESILNK